MFPLAQMVRKQRKLVIPIFVRPSFEHHEVEKRRYDHALRITDQFDAAKIRFIEILNERGYSRTDPQPQAIVWERMNRPIAGALRSFLYVLSDLSQVDPSDLSTLFAGEGRLRMGFAELEADPGSEPKQRSDRGGRASVLGRVVLRLPREGRDLARVHPRRLVEHRRCQDQESNRWSRHRRGRRRASVQSAVRARRSDTEALGCERHLCGVHGAERGSRVRLDAVITRRACRTPGRVCWNRPNRCGVMPPPLVQTSIASAPVFALARARARDGRRASHLRHAAGVFSRAQSSGS